MELASNRGGAEEGRPPAFSHRPLSFACHWRRRHTIVRAFQGNTKRDPSAHLMMLRPVWQPPSRWKMVLVELTNGCTEEGPRKVSPQVLCTAFCHLRRRHDRSGFLRKEKTRPFCSSRDVAARLEPPSWWRMVLVEPIARGYTE